MKIGILTFHYAINYGAVLQAYAIQKWLMKQGVESEIINYVPIEQELKYNSEMVKKNCLIDLKTNSIKSIARFVRYKLLIERDYVDKINKFIYFLEKNVRMSSIIRCREELDCFNIDRYDAIICGSDQIWNLEITKEFDKTYFCEFVKADIRRIAYGASVGDISVLNPLENKEEFFRLLSNFNFIGVREQSLADFIVGKSDFNAITTLDPTLLLEKDDYEDIITNHNHFDREYVLVYQLARNPKAKDIALKVAKEKNLDIIEVCGTFYNKPHLKNVVCNAGPSEFLGLIRDASYVVTNSFHGTTLSIIFQKDFNTILSEKRNSRIVDLLKSMKLENRVVNFVEDKIETGPIQYSLHLESLEQMKKQSNKFLKESIGLENE